MRFVTGSLAASRGRPGRLLPPARCPAPARRRPSLAGSRLLAAKDGLTAFSRVLNSDYRGTGVSSTSLILGPVKALNRLSGADKLMTSVADHRERARTQPAPRPDSASA